MRRRQFLVLAGLSATATLAGCGGTDDTAGTAADRDDSEETTTPTGTVSMRNDTAASNTATRTSKTEMTAPDTETATSTPLTLETPQPDTNHRLTLTETSPRQRDHERSRKDYATAWTFPSATGSHSIVSPGLQGTDYALKFNGFQTGALDGTNAGARGLHQGDRFAFSFKPTNYTGTPSLLRFQFACSGGADGNMYRIEFEGSNTTGSDWSLEKYANGSPTKLDAAGDGVGAALGEEYRIEVEWNTGDTQITARWYNPDGTQRSTPLSITDTEFTQPGVCLSANANVTVLWDEIVPVRR